MKKTLQFIHQKLRGQKIKHYQIYWEENHSNQIELAMGREWKISSADECGFALRFIYKGEMRFCSFSKNHLSQLPSILEQAISSNLYSPTKPSFKKIKPLGRNSLNYNDPNFSKRTLTQKKNFLTQQKKKILSVGKNKIKPVSLNLEESESEVGLVDFRGDGLKFKKTFHDFTVIVNAKGKNDNQSAFESVQSPFFNDLIKTNIAQEAAKTALGLVGAKTVAAFVGQALLPPSVVCELLEILAATFYADKIKKKESYFAGKKGKVVFSPLINIIDNPLNPYGSYAYPWDQDGSTCRENTLIKNGRVLGFLNNQAWAMALGEKLSANQFSTHWSVPPHIESTNLYIKPGRSHFKEMLSSIDQGIWITETIGMHTADALTGDFSVGISGFYVKQGREAGPISQMMWSGNIFKLFKEVLALGHDLKFYGAYGAPFVFTSKNSFSS